MDPEARAWLAHGNEVRRECSYLGGMDAITLGCLTILALGTCMLIGPGPLLSLGQRSYGIYLTHNRRICAYPSWLMGRLCHDVSMSKRSRRLGKKIELRAVEEAIGASLGKNPAQVAAESRGEGGKVRRKEVDRDASKARPR
jgi:hypothetical protein